MIKFPQKGVPIVQAPKGNLQGSLWSTFNIDLKSNPGRIRLGDKLNTITTSADDADLGTPVAFVMFAGAWWAICGTRIFRGDSSSSTLGETFTEDSSTGAQTDYTVEFSDLALFNDRLWATTGDGLYSKGGYNSTWVLRDDINPNIVHKMTYFQQTDRLYYVDRGSRISSIDINNVAANTSGSYHLQITDSDDRRIATMTSNSSAIYISMPASGASDTSVVNPENRGIVGIWDGISPQLTTQITLDSSGIMAMAVKDDIVYGVDTRGRFLKFNGYGFEEIGRLPFNLSHPIRAMELDSGSSISRHIHYNGLVVTDDNTLLALINGRLPSNSDPLLAENVPSGIWECDLATGSVTHKHSLSYKNHQSSTITDFGQYQIQVAGALALQRHERGFSSVGRTNIICGATVFSDNGSPSGGTATELPAIFLSSAKGNSSYTSEGEKRGYFVTTWIDSNDIQDTWQKLGIKHRKYLDSDDKIVVKYRTTEADPVYADITWTSTTTFTTTTDISNYWTSGTGGEVEIILGTGSGTCAHITSIVNNAGTYTVTIDEIATGVTTGTAKARFQAWTKIAALTQQNLESEVNALGVSSERIQFKVVMHFTGDGEFHEMQVSNTPHIKL